MFKKMHDTSERLAEKLGDVPCFTKMKDVNSRVSSEEGKHLVEPVDSVTHDAISMCDMYFRKLEHEV